jgi:hypothetical protein
MGAIQAVADTLVEKRLRKHPTPCHWRSVQVMNFLILQFSSYLLSLNILLSALFSFAVSLFSFSIEEEISHPHRKTKLRQDNLRPRMMSGLCEYGE